MQRRSSQLSRWIAGFAALGCLSLAINSLRHGKKLDDGFFLIFTGAALLLAAAAIASPWRRRLVPLLALLCAIGLALCATFALLFGWKAVGGNSAFDLLAMLAMPPGILALAWSLEWLSKWRWRQRLVDHEAAFAQLMSRRDDGLTEFQHQAMVAAAHIVPLTSFRRDKDEDGEVLVAPLGSAGAELWLYPYDAAVRDGKKRSSFSALEFKTPQDLFAALLNECQARAA